MESKKFKGGKVPLPEDLILGELMPRLPTRSLLRFKCVSKSWLSLISQHSSLIAAKHTAGEKPVTIISGRYMTDDYTVKNRLFLLGNNQSKPVEIETSYIYQKTPQSVLLIGSCNGLVCLKLGYSDKTHDLILWNPATREVNYLLTREAYPEYYTKYALGHDARSGVDKVVRLIARPKESRLLEAQIFSKKSGRWSNLNSSGGITASVIICLKEGGGLTIDGAVYWKIDGVVLSFDLSKAELRKFGGPPIQFDEYELIQWKGSLGAVCVEPRGAEIELWLKNKDSNNSDSGWQKISTFQPSLGPISLASGPISLGRGFRSQIIPISYRDDRDVKKQICYDMEEKRELELGCLEKLWWSHNCEHFCTLISPN